MLSKSVFFKIHRWAGLLVCTLVLTQAATGTLLVFRYNLEEVLDPAGMVSAPYLKVAPISAVARAARARFPGYGIDHIVFPATPEGVYVVQLLDVQGHSRWASVDAGSATVRRAGSIWSFPLEAAMQIHYRLMSGRAGLALFICSGVALLTLALSGLAFWWPRAGRWRKSLAIEKGVSPRILLRRLHRNVGVFAAVSAIFSSLTGLVVATQFFIAPGPLVTMSVRDQGMIGDLDAAVARAQTIFPERGIRDVRLPSQRVVSVFFWAPQVSTDAVDAVAVDLQNGRVVSVTPADRAPLSWMTVLAIHSGHTFVFGVVGALVLLCGAIAVFGLAATGPLMWLQRRSARHSRRRSTQLRQQELFVTKQPQTSAKSRAVQK